MTMRKILVVPAELVTNGLRSGRQAKPSRRLSLWERWVAWLQPAVPRGFLFCGEVLQYADLSALLGGQNVFVAGGFHPAYHASRVSSYSTHPSCLLTPSATVIPLAEIPSFVRGVDAVLVSIRAGTWGREAIRLAREAGVRAAVLDFFDHEDVMVPGADAETVFRGLLPGRDVDVYFKKELTAAFRSERAWPIAPVPVRPESYAIPRLAKRVDVFYSGRARPDKCQPERAEIVEVVTRARVRARIVSHHAWNTFASVRGYWRDLAEARIALSPAGRVWDSFRHCEVGLAGTTALLAPEPYVETVGDGLVHGHSALLYAVTHRDGRFHVANPDRAMAEVREYLAAPGELQRLAATWREVVMKHHTVRARAEYLLRVMEGLR